MNLSSYLFYYYIANKEYSHSFTLNDQSIFLKPKKKGTEFESNKRSSFLPLLGLHCILNNVSDRIRTILKKMSKFM